MQSAAASGEVTMISGELARSWVSIGGPVSPRASSRLAAPCIPFIYHPVVVQLELWIGPGSGCIRQGEISGLINETAPGGAGLAGRGPRGVLCLALAHVSPT
jgi:hypothetical protein